jgi:hypothetical protein
MATLLCFRIASCADPSTQAPSLCGHYPLPRYYGPVRLPPRPGLSLAGVRLVVPRHHRSGSPVLRLFSLQACRRHYPGGPAEPRLFRLILAQTWGLGSPRRRPSPLHHGVGIHELCFEACSAFTCVTACRLAESLLRPFGVRSFSRFVTSSTVPTATGWNNPTSRAGLAPAGEQRLFTAHGA